ncbi:RiPP maturation radical SAM protein 1 [Micromonospora qiuiae]|uniref:RiPP maturation radical SAM protein 1 n=1 Tax=Micromonospora qiuiae TaxID=502268 RepID=A0ABQ4JAV6_9ACTN|nr:RiPP maturation radical SAM C-methyltransferase [Micromonospora qiuiae]GIJ27289.1 RiPP maturation radical SAM protein 1 [Micromonospora qiuiae]
MHQLVLVNMPFADRRRPSFALSQLSALVRRDFPDDFEVRVCYVNHDFVRYFGAEEYDAIAGDMDFHVAGVGDWMFRQIAFPELPDNADEYFSRYFTGPAKADLRRTLLRRRAGLRDFLLTMVDKYRLTEADLLGFSSMFTQNVPSLAVARIVKDRNSAVTTMMGGANCEAPMGAALAENCPQLDFVFSGPALLTFPEFLRCVIDGNLDRAHQIRGIVTRRNCAEGGYRKAIGANADIDDYFDPDYTSFRESFDQMVRLPGAQAEPMLFFETSRGCWWGERAHCTFCGLNGQTMAYRAMRPENALKQFDWLFSHAPWAKRYCCTDNIMPMDYLTEVFPKLDPPEGISIFYEVKVGLDIEDMTVLERAGVNEIQPGIEAMATPTLKLMRKGTSSFQNIQFLKNCLRLGISPVWNLLIGFPGEAEDTYRQYVGDLPLLLHLPPPQGCFPVRFDRFSPYFNNATEYGLELEPVDHYRLTYPFDRDGLRNVAYYFADQKVSDYMISAATWLRPLRDRVSEWNSAWAAAARPSLTLTRADGVATVHDSRSGQERSYTLDDLDTELLLHLDKPVRVDKLAAELPRLADVLDSRLAGLRERQLLFFEGQRVMSVCVSDSDVDPMPRPRRTVVGGARSLPLSPARLPRNASDLSVSVA